MRQGYLILLICLFSIALNAQDVPVPTTWKIKKVSISMGVDKDMVNNLNQGYLASTAKFGALSEFADRDFDTQDFYAGVCENPHLRAFVTFDVPGWQNVEVNTGINVALNRVDGVFYSNQDAQYGYEADYLSYDVVSNEVALDISMVKRLNILNTINIYAGGGTNLGYQFGGSMHIMGMTSNAVDDNLERPIGEIFTGEFEREEVYESHETRNGINNRIFAEIGVGVLFFQRLELALEYRRGIGYRAIFGSEVRMTNLRSTGLVLRWVLNS